MCELTLTFDNGPEPETTPHVLEVLARRAIRSTFFVIGEKLVRARALAERAHAEGHWIGNHTWTHRIPFGDRVETDTGEREIGTTQAAIGELSHLRRYFRPFGGGGHLDRRLFNPSALDFLKAGGFTCVLWHAIPRDWSDPEGWVERALAQCRAQPWTLMALHDVPSGAMRHLEDFLDRVQQAGAHLRQDFPPDCMPIVEGIVVRPIEDYVTRR